MPLQSFSWYIVFPVGHLPTWVDLFDSVRAVLSNPKSFLCCFSLIFCIVVFKSVYNLTIL